ncbi:MAG: formate dehydrogenase accessory sulfurtransferase FdhD, partial [Pirellulaceae bacterium]|nr:formate dehydrogenase accessory sulfurtransferase FdhD [Pirellulaceae bacterium]
MKPHHKEISVSQETRFEIVEFSATGSETRHDVVVTEEPVEIRIVFGADAERAMRSVSITMRTPGNDQELAAGFLMAEGILTAPEQMVGFKSLGVDSEGQETGNIVRVDLASDVELDLGRLQRNFLTSSSCGVCGKASLEALEMQGLKPISGDAFKINSAAVRSLPADLRRHQETFSRTGGLHAAGLFNPLGSVVSTREDVGRHNAVDKLVGRCFLDGQAQLLKYGMIVSGRVSFEIMQKALV